MSCPCLNDAEYRYFDPFLQILDKFLMVTTRYILDKPVVNKTFNSLHAEIVCTTAIINAEINVICLRVKVSSVA